MKTTLTFRLCCMVFAVILQSACSTLSSVKEEIFVSQNEDSSSKNEQPLQTETNIEELHIPEPGEMVNIFDPRTQQNITVIFGETFASASGKLCSSVTITSEKTANTQHGLVCLNENNEWDKNPMNIQLIQSP